MIQRDIDFFYWINSHHTPWLDWVMWVASQGWSWAIVLTATIIYMVVKTDGRWFAAFGWIMAGVGLCFLFSDRISVMCFKDVFCRLRPCHALENVRMFQTSCGGLYGFVSSHAANVFALALFLTLRFKQKRKHNPNKGVSLLTILIFFWAILVSYSRPYLGKHYPGDVVCGALLGLLVGVAVFFIIQSTEKWTNRLVEQKKSAKR